METKNEKSQSILKLPQTDSKWFWTEPTEEEFERLMKTKTFYRLYMESKDADVGDIVLYKFWANNDDEAYQTLQDFKADNPDVGEVFYSSSGYYIDADGRRFDTFRNMMGLDKPGLFVRVLDFIRYRIPQKLDDLRLRISDTLHFFRTGHSFREKWSLDYHMLDDLRHNLPIMIENLQGCPSYVCERARKTLAAKNPSENGYDEDEMELAMKMRKEELEQLLDDVLLYQYYEGFGIVDEDDTQMKKIDAKYRCTLPYKPGTNKEFDYEKLTELRRRHWNAVWDWVREYGESLWD